MVCLPLSSDVLFLCFISFKAEEQKLQLVDLVGMGNLLEALVAEDVISCEERDRIILRIAEKHGFTGYSLSTLAGYGRSKREVMELATHRKTSAPWSIEQDESYVSLTKIAQTHSEDSPRYAIQSWLRSGNTLAFLNLWEKENNPDYSKRDRKISVPAIAEKYEAIYIQKILQAISEKAGQAITSLEELYKQFPIYTRAIQVHRERFYSAENLKLFSFSTSLLGCPICNQMIDPCIITPENEEESYSKTKI